MLLVLHSIVMVVNHLVNPKFMTLIQTKKFILLNARVLERKVQAILETT